MACGAAVLTTDRLSLSEVGGDAVRYARSPDAGDLADALADLLADPVERRRLGQAGLARSAAYTWDATARGHLDVFERVLAR
jgi:glycosyltransferase involved in cell wall biosynthesis